MKKETVKNMQGKQISRNTYKGSRKEDEKQARRWKKTDKERGEGGRLNWLKPKILLHAIYADSVLVNMKDRTKKHE